MKFALFCLLLGAIFIPDAFAYANMANQTARANNLNMALQDYTFAMAISGTVSGFIFAIFVWKVK